MNRFNSVFTSCCISACLASTLGVYSIKAQEAIESPSKVEVSKLLASLNEEPRFPNSEDLRHIKSISSPQLSPDGKRVLFSMTDSTADGAKSHLWLVDVTGGNPRQLTYSPENDKRGEHNATWSPDGSAIFFLAKRGEHTQLFRLPASGGEARPYELKVVPAVDDSKEKDFVPPAKANAVSDTTVSAEPITIDVSGFAVSPDGQSVAVWARDPETPGEKKGKHAKADAVWVDHERHGERLYLASLSLDGDLEAASLKAIKPVGIAPDVRSASWSPKSDRLLVVNNLPNNADDLGPSATGWLVNRSDPDKPVALNGIPATVRGSFGWRPDGSQVVFAAQTPEDAPPGFEELFSLNLPASGSGNGSPPPDGGAKNALRLTQGYQGGIGAGEPIYLPGHSVLAATEEGTRRSAVRFSLDGKSAPQVVQQSTPIVSNLSTNRAQTGWVWLAQASDQPDSLCFAPKLGLECRELQTPSLTTQRFKTARSLLVQWKSDAFTIEGLLYLPPDESDPKSAKRKFPLIVDVHGGPLGAWADEYGEWTNFLVGHGWAVLRPNPRGSNSYGVKFAAANKNDLGGGDFRDVMLGVDAALKDYPLDPDRLALMGYSYGGEMAGFAEGKTDRFKAIISGAPVIDQFSEYGTERGSWYDRWYFGRPWENFQDAWRQSPLSGAGKAKTPLLLLQGESDGTDPLGQSEEMYRALRQAGVPVELVTYPREDHGPLARGIFGYPVAEPWHGYDARQHIVDFLDKAFAEVER